MHSVSDKLLTIFLWNANGISKHKNDLQIVLEEKKIDTVFISEKHLSYNSYSKITDKEIILANHPDGTAHGKAALIISNKIEHSSHSPLHTANIKAVSTSVQINWWNKSIYSFFLFSIRAYLSHQKALCTCFITKSNFQYWGRLQSTLLKVVVQSKLEIANYTTSITNQIKTNAPNSPTYWPTHANRHPDIIYFFLTRFQTKIVNLNDLASDYTPIFLKIDARPVFAPLRLTITPGFTNWNQFSQLKSSSAEIDVRLKSAADIDQAIYSLTFNIQEAVKLSSTQLHRTYQSNSLTSMLWQLFVEKRRARSKWQRS